MVAELAAGDDAGRVVAELVAEHAPLDLDALAELVGVALVAAVVAELATGVTSSARRP